MGIAAEFGKNLETAPGFIEMMLEKIQNDLRDFPDVTLVAVSKFHPAAAIRQAYDEGQRVFGESRVQELVVKQQELPNDIQWHFIGHLQTNKVKQIVPFVSLIHSIDTPHLLETVSREAEKIGRKVPVLLQLHVAKEETKFGFTIDECRDFLNGETWRKMTGVEIVGMMCMASNTDDETRVRADFHEALTFFNEMKVKYPQLKIKSWGMSSDYKIAIEEGATHIRVGSLIFGERY